MPFYSSRVMSRNCAVQQLTTLPTVSRQLALLKALQADSMDDRNRWFHQIFILGTRWRWRSTEIRTPDSSARSLVTIPTPKNPCKSILFRYYLTNIAMLFANHSQHGNALSPLFLKFALEHEIGYPIISE